MKSMLKVYFLLIAFVMGSLAGYSQVTTSGMNGKITGANNESLPGATVLAVHQPSGTQYGTVSNSEGRFSLQGMRSGGPYNIEVSFVGYNKQTFKGVSLSLGETTVLNVTLKEEMTDVNEVIVVASKSKAVNSEKNGSSINVDSRQMVLMPTITRSINDVTRLTPQANGNTIGGGNYRQNYITVDGAQFNNAFGIGTNLPGNGSPISLDALDQISVNITPFDVRQSGFTGASVNAITRSGTNEFSGSVYTYMNDEKYKGNKVGGATFIKSPSSYQMQGARLGGPIIKNKLFFFVNYETEKSEIPGPSRVAATADMPSDGVLVARPTATEMDMMSKYLLDNYGYQTGPYQGYSNESPGSKMLARIDWNISKNHKFNVRYSDTRAKTPATLSYSTSPFSPAPYTGLRTAMDAMWYKNSGYYQETNFTSLASELNSTFGQGKFANTLRYTYSFQDEPRSTEGNTFPFVDILKDNKAFTSFGTELFSYGNLREVKTTTITDDFSWTMGRNHFTIGAQYENNNTKNGFMRFGSSFYVFKSWDDFVNGANPQNFGITFSNTPGYEQAFPSFEFNQYSGYIQDEIAVSSKLKISAGFRVDLPTYSQPAQEHPIIKTLTFGDQQYSTATLPKSRMLFAPRVGFNYDVMGDGSLIVRGGTGIFTGRVPFVWIVGQVSDAGMIQTTQTYSGAAVPGPFNPDPRAYYPETQPVAGTLVPETFTIISDDFKMPQSWKSSFAIDAKLPWGIKGSLEGLYNADFNTAFFVNTGLKGGVPMNIEGYPDNRIVYPTTLSDRYYYIHESNKLVTTASSKSKGVSPIVLTNEKGGYYYSGTVKLEKAFNRGFYGMVAYTHSEAKNLVDGAGDQASSAWNGNANVNGANSVEKSFTSYVTPDKVIANVSYRIEYLKHMATTLSVFYEGGAPSRFSYVYSTNIVRDGAGSNNLIYVPKDASEITFVDQTVTYKDAAGTTVNVPWTAQAQSDAFFAYVDQDKYLKTRKGKYAERNGAVMPWRNQFDVKAMHEFFINVGGKRNSLQVSLDILNVGNLLNKDWGKAQLYNQNNILVPANSNLVVAGGTVKPTFKLNPYNNEMLKKSFKDNVGYPSTFSMQLGIRYIFN